MKGGGGTESSDRMTLQAGGCDRRDVRGVLHPGALCLQQIAGAHRGGVEAGGIAQGDLPCVVISSGSR